jgi:putative transposase
VFVERLWRTVKQEDIYLKGYESVSACKAGLEQYFTRYNTKREHSSLEYNYPAEIYFGSITINQAA